MLLVGSTPAIPRPLRKSRCQPADLCVPWQVTHTKEVDGKIRLRFKLGWVSAFSADGYTTLMVCPSARKLTRATLLNPLTSPPGRPRAMRLDVGNISGKDWRFPCKLSKRGADIPKHTTGRELPEQVLQGAGRLRDPHGLRQDLGQGGHPRPRHCMLSIIL